MNFYVVAAKAFSLCRHYDYSDVRFYVHAEIYGILRALLSG